MAETHLPAASHSTALTSHRDPPVAAVLLAVDGKSRHRGIPR
jgi:hypothetical protein